MMMQTSFIKKKLKEDKPVLGLWSLIPSPIVAELAGMAGLDFQILDMEHGVFDLPAIEASVRASEAVGCSPIVRVPTLLPYSIQNCLDVGAHGIIVPQVQNFQSAKISVQSALYPPAGTRGFNPFTRAGNYQGGTGASHPKLSNGFALTSLIIENQTAFEDLDKILEIPELDLVYLGVYDMSVALGCVGDFKNPAIVNFLESSIPRIRKAGKAAGVMVKSRAEMEYFVKLGANFLVFGVDTFVILKTLQDARSMLSLG